MILNLQLTQQDLERLDRLARRLPGSSKMTLAQHAFLLGLEVLEKKPPPAPPPPPVRAAAQEPAGEDGAEPKANVRDNLQKLKVRLDRLETQVKEFFDTQATATSKVRPKKK